MQFYGHSRPESFFAFLIAPFHLINFAGAVDLSWSRSIGIGLTLTMRCFSVSLFSS
jgi:hypothetical protein